MKTVLSSQALAHAWAHQTQSHARRADRNMSFDGPAFRSYQTVIARILTVKGRTAYIVDRSSFSNSTSKHQSHVWHAIPESVKTFSVSMGKWGQTLNLTPAELRDYYLSLYRAAPSTSRYRHMRAANLLSRVNHLSRAIEVCAFFGLPTARLSAMLSKHETERVSARAQLDVHESALDARRSVRNAARSARWARAAELRALSDADKAAKWLEGESVQLSYDHPVLLRAKDDLMETSRGASVPLYDAERLYRFVAARRARGAFDIDAFGPVTIGQYTLDSVNAQGVVVGCHRVSWAEVDRFAGLMGWIGAESPQPHA